MKVLYFFKVNAVKYTDKTLTRGFGCLGDYFFHFIVWRSEKLVLPNELIKVALPERKSWKVNVSSFIRAHYALTKG